MAKTNKIQIAEPLQLFISLYDRAFGVLNIPFVHRRLSFRASTDLYYPQPHEYVSNKEIKGAIAKNPKETIFSCLSRAMRDHRMEQEERFKEYLGAFEKDWMNYSSLNIRYADSIVVPEGFTLRQILSGLEDEKVEGIERGLFENHIMKPKDKEKEQAIGIASSFAAVDMAYPDIHWSYAEWEKHYNDLSERYTVFLRPTIICIGRLVNYFNNNSEGVRIIPVQDSLFDASSIRGKLTGSKVRCEGLIQIISEKDLKLAETSSSSYLLSNFQKALQILPGIFDSSHYDPGKSLFLEGILLTEDRINE